MNPLSAAAVVPVQGASFFGVTLVGVSTTVGVMLSAGLAPATCEVVGLPEFHISRD